MEPRAARAAFDDWRARVNDDWWADDPHLQAILAGRETADIAAFGKTSAREIDPLVRENNRDEHLPVLRRWDGQGNRIEAVDFHPSYHRIGEIAYATGAMSRYAEKGRELETLGLLYLFAQNGEGGHACPFACTAGMIKILQGAPPFPHREAWLAHLYDADYRTHYHAAQFLTEVQGGSDVGSNAVTARQDGDRWRLTGEKWFCSVIDAHLFLVSARPEGAPDGTRGVAAFVVPRLLADGSTNHFAIRRLKYKLGTRSMASAEVDFTGAEGWRVGDFRQTVEVVLNTSRLYNAVCSAAGLQRAFREAHAYAWSRVAFGQPIARFPTVARLLARLRTEAYAARGLTLLLADLSDRLATGRGTPDEAAALRMLVNLNKYWTAIAATLGIRDAIEVLGGNGAIEEFTVLPRLLRDMIVCEAWEGGHNVLCTQAWKDSVKLGYHEPMFRWLRAVGGGDPRLDAAEATWKQVIAMPADQALWHVRDMADALRPAAQAAALRAVAAEGDPLRAVAMEHLLATTSTGWDPLSDPGLSARVETLAADG
jgi:alkylation response protein AidB-like acyl-CoA dehydrogenase